MKISTEIASAARLIGEERAVAAVARAGFDAWDFSMFEMCDYNWASGAVRPSAHPLASGGAVALARRLRQIGLDNGIRCNQSHAPFPSEHPVIRDHLKLAIECTAEAGGDMCIIHPGNLRTAQENADMYGELLPFAKACGVRIATENMWCWDAQKDQCTFAACATPKSFLEHLALVDDPCLVACLDLGHAEMRGLGTSAVEMIRALGTHLQALHIHDNDLWHDSHQIPFSMQMDFAPIMQALREAGYQGYLTLEADQYLSAYTPQTAAEGIARLADAARRLEDMFLGR